MDTARSNEMPRDSFIEVAEYEYFRKLASAYDGEPALIVDAGCFAGASTKALCEGAVASPAGLSRKGVVAIDRFLVMDHYIAEHFAKHGAGIRFGESFLSVFMGNLSGFLENLDIRPGELTQVGRVESKIRLLAIDIAKSPATNAYILNEWFRLLIPGESIVLHQDFHAPSQPWIATTMGALIDHFDIEMEKIGETATFKLRRQIPIDAIREAASMDWQGSQGLKSLERLMERFSDRGKTSLTLIKALILRRMRRLDEAASILESLLELNPQPTDKKWHQWLSMALATIDPSVFSPHRVVADLYMDDACIRLGHWH